MAEQDNEFMILDDDIPSIEVDGKTYSLDNDGNLINDDKTVFKTKAEYEESKTPSANPNPNPNPDDKPEGSVEDLKEGDEVSIEDKSYKIDANGNAIDSDGKVFKTKAELIELQNDSNEESDELLIDDIVKLTGIEVLDEEGNALAFNNDKDGLSAYIQAVYDKGAEDKTENVLIGLYERFPAVEKLVTHLINNDGDITNFKLGAIYSNAKIDEKNEDSNLEIIRAARKAKGDTEEEISYFINLVKNDKKVIDTAKTSLKYLQTIEEDSFKAEREEAAVKEQARLNNENERVNTIQKIVKSGEFEMDGTKLTIPKIIKVNEGGIIKEYDRAAVVDFMTTKRTYIIDGTKIVTTGYEVNKFLEKQRTDSIPYQIYESIKFLTGSDSQLIKSTLVNEKSKTLKLKLTKKQSSSAAGKQNQSNDLDLPIN